MHKHFLVIDDDPINNHICSKYIEIVFSGAKVETFAMPQTGLDYISATYSETDINETILFLDINMPVLSGWDVLEKFVLFSEKIRQQFTIYILSSSVDIEDKKRADNCNLVAGFLEKPLSVEQLQELKEHLDAAS